MSADIQLIEKPIKYASIAMLVFVVSGFLLGKAYEYLALVALDLPSSAYWGAIEDIAGLTVDRAARYFVFFFVGLLALRCYDRSPLKSSPWGMLILFAVLPAAMSFIPFLFTEGMKTSPIWAFETIILTLLYMGVGGKCSSRILRNFFRALISGLVLIHFFGEAGGWWDAVHSKAINIFGEGHLAESRTNSSLFWFAPAALVSAAVNLYLTYWLPKKYFQELNTPVDEAD